MSFAKFWKIWVLDLERSEASKIEGISFKDLERIGLEARNFGIDLVLIGGYAVRAYTEPRSWRFTKDVDFITTRKDLTALLFSLSLVSCVLFCLLGLLCFVFCVVWCL